MTATVTKRNGNLLTIELTIELGGSIRRRQRLDLAMVLSILYIDEAGWKVGKKHCYTWVFGTFADVYYRCGVGRGKDELEEVIGKVFAGTGVSDNYGAYDSIFTKHQLCWAHLLRKAIELMLRYPANSNCKRQDYLATDDTDKTRMSSKISNESVGQKNVLFPMQTIRENPCNPWQKIISFTV